MRAFLQNFPAVAELGDAIDDPPPRIRPGARLVREWCGRTHTVIVTDSGFEYAKKGYSSLTQIAQTITGAYWSGPCFFGLNRSKASVVQRGLGPNGLIGKGEDSDG